MHVGGLQLFSLPAGADKSFIADLYQSSIECADDIHPLFRKRPHRSPATGWQWSWEQDQRIDLEYHVRHSALPQPGRVRELLALTSRLHGTLLDRNRPLWEAHLIEGLEGDRIAIYTKIHHAVVDGVSALAILQNALSEDPAVRDLPPPWAMPRRHTKKTSPLSPRGAVGLAGGAVRVASEAFGAGRAVVGALRDGISDRDSALPFRAPRTILNRPITGARRFAADSWDLARVKAVGKAAGGTLNDAVLAMTAGALRAYLLEQGELPDAPLIAMVPMALPRAEGDDGGNAVAAILCSLATDVEDAGERLTRIRASMQIGKDHFAGLTPTQALALSALNAGGVATGPLSGRGAPIPFNLVISNVPGPRKPLWWNGARLEGVYPLSIPIDGQALNVTVNSYVDNLEFGLIGCRRSVPHLQRLLVHLEDSLVGLEKAVA